MAISTEDKAEIIRAMKSEIVITLDAMKPEITGAVAAQVDESVNGKINSLKVDFAEHVRTTKEHHEKVDKFMEHMSPMGDTISFLKIFRTFTVWGSGFAIAIAVVWGALMNIPNLFK